MNRRQILGGVAILIAGLGIVTYLSFDHYVSKLVDESNDPGKSSSNIHLSGTITPSISHPLSGFWKGECSENFGLAVAAAGPGLYSVSFCGPGGCFKPGWYRPNTAIVGDPEYKLDASATAFTLRGNDGGERQYKKCWPAAGDA